MSSGIFLAANRCSRPGCRGSVRDDGEGVVRCIMCGRTPSQALLPLPVVVPETPEERERNLAASRERRYREEEAHKVPHAASPGVYLPGDKTSSPRIYKGAAKAALAGGSSGEMLSMRGWTAESNYERLKRLTWPSVVWWLVVVTFKPSRAAYMREYSKRPEARASRIARYQASREVINDKAKAYYSGHQEVCLKRMKTYRDTHKEKIALRQILMRSKNAIYKLIIWWANVAEYDDGGSR